MDPNLDELDTNAAQQVLKARIIEKILSCIVGANNSLAKGGQRLAYDWRSTESWNISYALGDSWLT